jgi:NADH-quinone oxidoreductase subunit N
MATNLFYGLLPEHILLALILLLMLLEIVKADTKVGTFLFILGIAAGCGVLASQLGQGYSAIVVPGEILVDRFALISRLVILGCGLILGLSSLASSSSNKYWILISSSLLGALIMMDSAGFISLFIGIEMLSLPGFALMVHKNSALDASEGSIKYLIMSSVASALVLFGIALVYGSTGNLGIASFASVLAAGGTLNWAAAIMIICGLFLKASVFPFHGWAPDAYGSARLQVTAFLASVIKAAVILGLVRVLSSLPLNAVMITGITILSVVSILYGNTAAIRQTTFKRLLAYSSIAHAGYMIFALTDNSAGRIESLLYYVAVYAVTTIVACTCFGLLVAGEKDDLESLDGAFHTRPVASVLLALAVLSLAGIPPLPGFMAKLFIFKAVIASGHLTPAVLAFVGSYIGTIYYLGIVYRLFKPVTATEAPACQGVSAWSGVLLGVAVLTLFMLLPGLFQQLLAVAA